MPPPSGHRSVSGSFLARSVASTSFSSFHSSISVDTSELPSASLTRTSSGSSSGSGPTPKSRRSPSSTRRSPKPPPAIDRASETIVRRLLASGMSVHSTQAATSLISAAKTGEISLVRALVKAGVPVDAVHHDATAIMAAAGAGQLEVVQFLARHRADVEFRAPPTERPRSIWLAKRGMRKWWPICCTARQAQTSRWPRADRRSMSRCKGRKDGAGKTAKEYVTADCQEIAMMLDEFDRKTALLNATVAGDLEAVEFLVARGDDLETCGPEDETALLVAAGGGSSRVEIARVLLAAGADRAAALKNGSSALHLAVKAAARGGAAMVTLLLQEGVDPRSLDARGNRAQDYADDPHVVRALERQEARLKLLFAAETGNLSLVSHHATHGAEIETRGRADGVTPLLAAVQKGFADVARFLLDKGADPNAASTVGGLTPLHFAAEQGDYAMLECLLRYGADVNVADVNGKLAREYAIDDQVVELLSRHMETSVTTENCKSRSEDANRYFTADEPITEPESLSSCKSNVNCDQDRRSGSESITALADRKVTDEMRADKSGEVRLGAILNEAHATKEHDPINAINQRENSVEELSNSICSCSEPPPSYQSYLRVQSTEASLLTAVQRNDLETARRLLALDVDIELRSEDNNFTPLCWAAQAGNLEMVQLLIVEGAQVDAATTSGFTPLLLAASAGHAHVVQQLLMKGADSEACIKRSGFTALLVAVFNNYVGVVRHLVKKRVNLEVRSADGSTALHLAAEKGHAAVVQLLLAGGSNTNATIQRDGSTALHKAAFMNKPAVVWLLLRGGADPQLEDDKGLTAADQADSEQLKRILLATRSERDAGVTEAWWDQWQIRQLAAVPNATTGGEG
ncbi:hypothetical protein PF004_g5026 [Phytophthora fragariae]|uniref:Uncharacterized protein n=1 Tax=Phytophthora fragariae TaxID=53985 RepID=A0A6G0PH58_9STRA|nr:hypothetical protein PF004_g5026 [Phytophthora fragariae]